MTLYDEREKYCLSIIILNGGIIDYYILRDIILSHSESFSNVKHVTRAVRRTINKLIKKGDLTEVDDVIKIKPIMEAGFIDIYYSEFLKVIKIMKEYSKNNVMKYNVKMLIDYFEEYYLEDNYFLIEEIYSAYETYKNTENCEAVINSCGRCVEIIISVICDYFEIERKDKDIRPMIRSIKSSDIIQKKPKKERDEWMHLMNGLDLVYSYRSRLGAHVNYDWLVELIANSCLMMTFYYVDYFLTLLE